MLEGKVLLDNFKTMNLVSRMKQSTAIHFEKMEGPLCLLRTGLSLVDISPFLFRHPASGCLAVKYRRQQMLAHLVLPFMIASTSLWAEKYQPSPSSLAISTRL